MISRFFINRPIFASVISIVITLVGAIALFTLPIAQYPRRVAARAGRIGYFVPGAARLQQSCRARSAGARRSQHDGVRCCERNSEPKPRCASGATGTAAGTDRSELPITARHVGATL